jgi:TetR/AcrR family transcriptional regulator, transcriptional repressor for nem operon
MRYDAQHKDETRKRLIEAAGRGFRRQGFGGIGVDGLAKEAAVTSGAFYGHFSNKNGAFEAAVVAGLQGLRASILRFREEHGVRWLEAYVDFYTTTRRTCDLAESCALQSLTPEVQRAGEAIKSAFRREAEAVAQAIADGLEGGDAVDRLGRAWALMGILAGGVTLARAMGDPDVGASIGSSIRSAALALASPR